MGRNILWLVFFVVLGTIEIVLGSEGVYINCGGPTVKVGNVEWVSDKDIISNGTTYAAPVYMTNETDATVFNTSRYFGALSSGIDSYIIKVASARYYTVRLYFAEILYQPPGNRIFSVWVQNYSALSNFTLPSNNTLTIKDFHIYLEKNVNISFVRGMLGDPMVNAISVVPANSLYPWLNVTTNGTVPWERQYGVDCGSNDTAWRDTTGRMWQIDNSYLKGDQFYESFPASVAVNGTEEKPELLPLKIYQTYRATQLYSSVGETYYGDLIYSFPVKANTVYLIRLHAAKFESALALNATYCITIDNSSILDDFDFESYGIARAKVFDFKFTPRTDFLDVNISSLSLKSGFARGFISGIELFRVLDTLQGTETPYKIVPSPPPPEILPGSTTKNRSRLDEKRAAWEGAAIGAATTAVFLGLIFLLILRFCRPKNFERKYNEGKSGGSFWKDEFYDDGMKSGQSRNGDEAGSVYSRFSGALGARSFTFQELKAATNGFSKENVVGKGGFGLVYKASLGTGINVAVKRLSLESEQGEREFLTEVELLSRLHHRNLVNLIGYCEEDRQLMLVYEFVGNGTLREYLADEEKANSLTWAARLRIMLGAARGIEYLHQGATPPVIHRDIKTSNILLETCLDAKVADFGLSKLGKEPLKPDATHISTAVRGTMGYLDPQYFKTRRLTEKSDVFSFGVVLLEVLTGRLPIWLEAASSVDERGDESSTFNEPLFDCEDAQERINILVEWVLPQLKNDQALAIAAPQLQNLSSDLIPSFKAVADIAARCVETQPKDRPTMSEVVRALEAASRTVGRSVFLPSKALSGIGLSPTPESAIP